MDERKARNLGRALYPIVKSMKESGEWKTGELDLDQAAKTFLRLEERSGGDAERAHGTGTNSPAHPGKLRQPVRVAGD